MTTDFFKVPNSVQSTCKSVITRDNMYRALPVNCFSSFHLQWLNTLNFLNYTENYFDCEDFSMLFKSLLSSCNYNSAGLVEGDLYYQGRYVGRHMWNIILFCNPSWSDPLQSFRLFEYEPQIGAILINHQSFDGFTYVGDEVEW